MANVIVSDGQPFEIVALDAQYAGKRTSILKASSENGVNSLVFGIEVQLASVKASSLATTGDVTARDVTASRNVAATGTLTGASCIVTGNLGSGVDVVSGRDVTAVRKMTVNGALVLAGNPFRKTVVLGSNGVGPVALVGAKVNDIVVMAIDLTNLADVTDKFEGAVTVQDQIQQSAADNLSAAKILFLVLKQS